MEFISMGLNKAMGSIPIGFLPSQVTGLKIWNRFNSGITVTGAGVSQWDDQSGNGNHLKQGTDADRPNKEADGSILFDGVSEFLKADAFTFEQPETIFLLMRQVSWSGGERIIDGHAANSGAFIQATSTPQVYLFAGTTTTLNGDLTLGDYAVVTLVFNGASSSIQINNETPTGGDCGGADMGGFTLGTRGDSASDFTNVQAMENIAYSGVLDAATQTQIRKYLADVGNLSI